MKVVIYARVSSGNGRQDTERQVMELRQVAEKAGHEVVKCFEDFKSGIVPNKERPYLQECNVSYINFTQSPTPYFSAKLRT